ncbi:MAG: lysophospholipid acyltransferase family protein [bacterium]
MGVENIPKTGGFIVACNHISHLDPPAVGCANPRLSHFVAKEELFRQFFFSWYFGQIGIIPIKRGGGGRVMLDTAADAIKKGEVVTMFPEGTRSKTGMPGRPRTGFIVLAAMANCPIIPARVSGTYDCMPPGSGFPLPGKVQVVYGKPISWARDELNADNREQMISEAERVMNIILSLPGWHPKNAKINHDRRSEGGC